MLKRLILFSLYYLAVFKLLAIDVYFRSANVDPVNQRFSLQWQYPNPEDTSLIRQVQLLEVTEDALQNLTLDVFDSIPSYQTRYNDSRPNCCSPRAFAVRLEPKNPLDFPLFTNPFRTMQIRSARIDECTNTIRLTWTPFEQLNKNSPYSPIEGFEVEYAVLAYIGGGDFKSDSVQYIASARNAQSLSIPIEFEQKYYHLYVAAIYNEGRDTSYSNIERIFTDLPLRPSFIRIDSLISGAKRTKLYFTIDQNTEYTNFQIETSPDANIGFVPFMVFSDKQNTVIEFDNISLSFFRVSAINDCEQVTYTSPSATNLQLSISFRDLSNILEWNYVRYNTISALYTVYRTSPIWFQGYISETTENKFIDNLQGFPDSFLITPICYVIEAIVKSDTDMHHHTVRGIETCYKIEPTVFMPNAIQVTSQEQNLLTGKRRNLFEPISSFKHTYQMEIHSRTGQLVYTGRNPWNGREQNVGNFLLEGAYHYRIIIIFADGTIHRKEGSVALIY
ncbi:MAG: hypothetical protein ACRC9X_08415 [Bacteroidales bacterium]